MMQVPEYTDYGVLRGYKYVDKIVRADGHFMYWVYYKDGTRQSMSRYMLNTAGFSRDVWKDYLKEE